MHKFLRYIALVIVLAIGIFVAKILSQGALGQVSDNSVLEEATIVRISDGDTVVVSIDGVQYRVRMLEVDAPESVHADESKNSVYGERASNYTKTKLYPGEIIWLSAKGELNTDQYDRLLRMVWTDEPDELYDDTELRTNCYNARIVLDGYAIADDYRDDFYAEEFRKFQEEAMDNKVGLWSDASWWDYYRKNLV